MSEDLNENSSLMISIKKAAVILGVSTRTVWRMIADKQLTAYRFRRCTRLLLSQVLACPKASGGF